MKVCAGGGGKISALLAAELAHSNCETWIYPDDELIFPNSNSGGS